MFSAAYAVRHAARLVKRVQDLVSGCHWALKGRACVLSSSRSRTLHGVLYTIEIPVRPAPPALSQVRLLGAHLDPPNRDGARSPGPDLEIKAQGCGRRRGSAGRDNAEKARLTKGRRGGTHRPNA